MNDAIDIVSALIALNGSSLQGAILSIFVAFSIVFIIKNRYPRTAGRLRRGLQAHEEIFLIAILGAFLYFTYIFITETIIKYAWYLFLGNISNFFETSNAYVVGALILTLIAIWASYFSEEIRDSLTQITKRIPLLFILMFFASSVYAILSIFSAYIIISSSLLAMSLTFLIAWYMSSWVVTLVQNNTRTKVRQRNRGRVQIQHRITKNLIVVITILLFSLLFFGYQSFPHVTELSEKTNLYSLDVGSRARDYGMYAKLLRYDTKEFSVSGGIYGFIPIYIGNLSLNETTQFNWEFPIYESPKLSFSLNETYVGSFDYKESYGPSEYLSLNEIGLTNITGSMTNYIILEGSLSGFNRVNISGYVNADNERDMVEMNDFNSEEFGGVYPAHYELNLSNNLSQTLHAGDVRIGFFQDRNTTCHVVNATGILTNSTTSRNITPIVCSIQSCELVTADTFSDVAQIINYGNNNIWFGSIVVPEHSRLNLNLTLDC